MVGSFKRSSNPADLLAVTASLATSIWMLWRLMALSQSANVIGIDVYLHWRALCECRTNALAVLISGRLLLGTKSSLGRRLDYSIWFDVCFGKRSLKALQLSIERKNLVGLLELVQDYDLVIFVRSTTLSW